MKSHQLEWLFQNNGLIYLNNRQGSCGENLKVQLLESPLKVQNDPNTFWSIRGGSSELSSFHRMYPKNGPEWPDFTDHLWWESCIQFAFSVDNLVFMNYTLLPIGLIVLTCFFLRTNCKLLKMNILKDHKHSHNSNKWDCKLSNLNYWSYPWDSHKKGTKGR